MTTKHSTRIFRIIPFLERQQSFVFEIFIQYTYIGIGSCCTNVRHYHHTINPCTALACKISGLKDIQRHLQTVYFRVYNSSTFNARPFDEKNKTKTTKNEKTKKLSHAGAKRKIERFKGFKFCTIIGRFQVTS